MQASKRFHQGRAGSQGCQGGFHISKGAGAAGPVAATTTGLQQEARSKLHVCLKCARVAVFLRGQRLDNGYAAAFSSHLRMGNGSGVKLGVLATNAA